ncbi:MAG: UDP-N-acetylmuramate--L-alanine ligase [Chloroflexi bacterium]|jgi:UDP-N-acetylmuramate: L-alanyl-gamma-D-glutamyl-meso-diaminopimelate ligase|nr:MAG: UDP-N-acetylmuramate--L-alanine ligase [Chloroflexota bacterium]
MRIHFIGICGYAVSGLALVAKQLGHEVTGSDEDAYPPTTEILTKAGIKWVDGHAAANLTRWGKPDLVVQGNQVRAGNPETEAARRHHIRLVSEAEYWGELTADRYRIVVAGSAGKTTTASLIAWILRSAGRNPGFRLGMAVKDLGSAAAWGSGREFVFEGDEYTSAVFDPRPKFLHFSPQLAVLTNIDWDHPDVFPDPAAYEAVFRQFLEDLGPEDRLIANADDPAVRRLLNRTRANVETYGLRGGADWQGRDVQIDGDGMRFTAWHEGKVLAVVSTRIPGEHNATNALAALAASVRVGVPVPVAVDAIARFQGVSRRFEVRGQVRGVTLVDDYAHHPAKVRATVQAARERFHPGRVLACFVPHTYSRTLALIEGYADAFQGCALVVIGPIEPARERHLAHTVTAQDLANRIRGVDEVVTVDSARSAAYKLASAARPGDVIVFMSVRGFDDAVGKTAEVLERSPVA